jgi:hypothetical protein
MKAAAAHHTAGEARDFYSATLAPINHHDETKFRGWDAALLVVLFLEVGVLMRLILAT